MIVFSVAAATDSLDGYLARSRHAVTTVGKLLDPLAEQLARLGRADLAGRVQPSRGLGGDGDHRREFAVTGLRLIAAAQNTVISASPWGKVKTTTQVPAIIALILDDPPHTATTVLVACAVAATIWSGMEYFIPSRDVLREPA